MLHVYYGNDVEAVRQKALAVLSASGREIEKVDASTYAPGLIASALGASPLFGETAVYFLDNPSENEDYLGEYTALAKEMADSEILFVVVEKSVLSAPKKKLEAAGAILGEYKKVSRAEFNAFSLADALASKDKRTLWLLLQQAKAEGLVSEEIIGTLWWQLKSMRLAAKASTAEDAGLKEYPFKKAKAALVKFPLPEVEKASRELLKISHESRRGLSDLELGLEAWVLTL